MVTIESNQKIKKITQIKSSKIYFYKNVILILYILYWKQVPKILIGKNVIEWTVVKIPVGRPVCIDLLFIERNSKENPEKRSKYLHERIVNFTTLLSTTSIMYDNLSGSYNLYNLYGQTRIYTRFVFKMVFLFLLADFRWAETVCRRMLTFTKGHCLVPLWVRYCTSSPGSSDKFVGHTTHGEIFAFAFRHGNATAAPPRRSRRPAPVVCCTHERARHSYYSHRHVSVYYTSI